MKRDPLEEVKMRDEMDVTEGSDLRCQFASRSSNAMATPGSLNIIMQRQLASGQDVTMTSMPLIPRNAQVFEAKLISMFWECYVPSTSGAQVSSPCAWLQESISLVDPPPALRLSLTALAMTRLGWLRQDDAFVRRGRLVYGDALKELQQALTEEHSMCQTETLATCNVLALYEVGNIFVDVFRCSRLIHVAFRVDIGPCQRLQQPRRRIDTSFQRARARHIQIRIAAGASSFGRDASQGGKSRVIVGVSNMSE